MQKKERTQRAVEILKDLYPNAVCSLNYKTPFQLLIATRLSAQCTDARVNLVTPALFSAYPDAQSMAAAELQSVENLIKSCGLFKTKARDIIGIAAGLIERFGGEVPSTIEQLTTLPGVGRKTANLICGDIYGKPAVVTDTHFIRITNRLGLIATDNPLAAEKAMRQLLPPEESSDFCHRTVLFGRDICSARSPKCNTCPLHNICKKVGVDK